MRKYIEHLERENASLKLENSQLRQMLGATGKVEDLSEPSALSGMTGRPEIDAISTASFDIRARRPRNNILDSEVKGMEMLAKVNIPESHLKSGCQSNFTNKLSESSRS